MDEARFIKQLEAELDKQEAAIGKIRKLIERRVASQPELFGTEPAAPMKRAVRRQRAIPKDWWPEPETMKKLGEEFPNVNLENEAHAHKDYWISRGVHRADWEASYRNWIRLAATRFNGTGSGQKGDRVAAVSQSNSERTRDALDRLHQIRGEE